MTKTLLALAVGHALFAALPARADDTISTATSEADMAGGSTTLNTVQVNATLDKSRNQLSPDTGSSQYVLNRQAIDQLPLGDSTPLNQVLLQIPGVVQDSFGQLHVRG